jgi:hypothetical protein
MKKPLLPNKLDYRKAITDYLTKLGEMIKVKLKSHWQNLDFYSKVLIVLTVCLSFSSFLFNFLLIDLDLMTYYLLKVPAEFNDDAIAIMRDCAFNAGLMKERDSKYLIFTTERKYKFLGKKSGMKFYRKC